MNQTEIFVQKNLNSKITELLLGKKPENIDLTWAVQQIEALQKIQIKVPLWYRTDLHFPVRLSIEQASSQATALLKNEFFSAKTLLDLTGGLGIDSYFFSKSFQNVHYVEQNQTLCDLAKHNFEKLEAHNIEVFCQKAEIFLETAQNYDFIYLDPARRNDAQQKVFRLEDCTPNVLELMPILFKKAKKIVLKTAPLLDSSLVVRQLGNIEQILVIAVENDCKEVLYVFGKENKVPKISTFNLKNNFWEKLEDDLESQHKEKIRYELPKKYIYEPNAAIMKAGIFGKICEHFGLSKLHPNSHLFSSENLQKDFTGRVFELKQICKYDKKLLAKHIPEKKANISVRNFPETVAQIRQKTGIKEGGDSYIFATTNTENQKILLICEKINIL